LTEYLESRLQRYDGQRGGVESIDLATMFIVDSYGTIISIAYEKPVSEKEDSFGRNFAYRAYFHGGREDLDPQIDPTTVAPLESTHLSPAFFSTATLSWKVAVSTPIYLDPRSGSQQRPDAVFVATTNLGGFDLMKSDREPQVGIDQVTVLVDTRAGQRRGTIIQHPLLDLPVRTDPQGGPLARRDSPVRAPVVDPATLDALLAGQDIDYLDPMGREPGGQDFRGRWVAAAQPVALPQFGSDEREGNTDLLVLVEYRWSDVIAPVTALVNQLMLYGALAVAGILVVIFLLWAFVRRAGDDSVPVGPQTSGSGHTETIAAS
jgi:hypothetical protein